MTLPRVHQLLDLLYPRGWEDRDALEEGARLHLAMQRYFESLMQNKPFTPPEDPTGRLEKALTWCQNQDLTPLQIEQNIIDPSGRYSGTPDWYGLRGKIHTVADWKFSYSLTEANYVQAEAYRMLIPGSRVMLVQIPKTGPVVAKPVKKNPRFQAALLTALNLWEWKRDHNQLL